VSAEKLTVLKETFTPKILSEGQVEQAQIKKIQELLLSFRDGPKQVGQEEVGVLLFAEFQTMKQ